MEISKSPDNGEAPTPRAAPSLMGEVRLLDSRYREAKKGQYEPCHGDDLALVGSSSPMRPALRRSEGASIDPGHEAPGLPLVAVVGFAEGCVQQALFGPAAQVAGERDERRAERDDGGRRP